MIKFGPSGNSDSFYAQGGKRTAEAMKWVHDIGLNAYEYSLSLIHILFSPEESARGGERTDKPRYHLNSARAKRAALITL